jgi:cyclopropane-fatty-acyl-phospholipid synthase
MTSAAGTVAWLLDRAGLTLPVRLAMWDGSETGPPGPPVLRVRSAAALRRVLWRPDELGLARAWVSGDVDLDGDLTDGLRGLLSHTGLARTPVIAAVLAAARLKAIGLPPPPPASELRYRGRRHSKARDRAVIAGHYDLPAAFYRLILDEHMAYSCAWWSPSVRTLDDAQRAKLDLICDKLSLAPGSRLLDVGCGWGSLTVHAASQRRARVTAVTLAAEQAKHVAERLADLGLDDLAEVRVQDYRDIGGGSFDAIASVEMGEHVGAAGYPGFCAELHELLRPGGRLLIQQMSRSRAPGGGPFIESYIAPDMHMRPVGETVGLIEDAGFEVVSVQAMREHYGRTIRAWLARLEQNEAEATALLGEERVRVWRLYLAGGALAFEDGRMGVDQILAVNKGPA